MQSRGSTNIRVLLNKLQSNIASLKDQLKLGATVNDLGLHAILETTVLRVYNATYDSKLVNANIIEKNYPGIDGVDDGSKLMVQVTSTFGVKKIEHTIDQILKHNLYRKYNRLIFLFLTEKKPLSKATRLRLENKIQGKFSLDFDKGLIDLKDLYQFHHYKQDIESTFNAVQILEEVLKYNDNPIPLGYEALSVSFHDEELDNVFALVDLIIKDGVNVYTSSKRLFDAFKEANNPLKDFIIYHDRATAPPQIRCCICILSNAFINQISSNSTSLSPLFRQALKSEIRMEYISFDPGLKGYKAIKEPKIRSYRSVKKSSLAPTVSKILNAALQESAFGNIGMEEIQQELINYHTRFTPTLLHNDSHFSFLNLKYGKHTDISLNYIILGRDYNLTNVLEKIKTLFPREDIKNLNVLVPKDFGQKTRKRIESVKHAFKTEDVYYVDEHLFDNRFTSISQTSILNTTEFVSPVIRNNGEELQINDIIHWIFNNSDLSIAIIAGSGGIGKTTVCQKIHDIIIEDGGRNIVIFIDAVQYIEVFRKKEMNFETDYDLYNIFKACHAHASIIDKNSFYLNYYLGNIIVIFDGVDEIISTISSFSLHKFLDNLENLRSNIGKGKILINCRDTYVTDLKKFYLHDMASHIQIYDLLGFDATLAREFFFKHFKEAETVQTCMKLVREFYPDETQETYKYPPFILEIAIQIASSDFEYNSINADFNSQILLENEPNDAVVNRICNREYVKKEGYGFQLSIDQQVRFLCEMAIEEKGKISHEDFHKVLENIGVTDRATEVVKGLIDHPLLLKTNGNFVFRFEFFNTYFKSVAIFNLICTDIELKLTDRLVSILVQDCNFNSVISKTVILKAYNCQIPFKNCLTYSKIVITKLIYGNETGALQVARRKKAISNILVIILTSKYKEITNEQIISNLFGNDTKEIRNLYLIDIPHFAGIDFDFSGFYFSESEFINYTGFFNCKFDKNTFFDETCEISAISSSKVNLKNIEARENNFDKHIKGDNSIFRVLFLRDNPEVRLVQYFREYLSSFFVSGQFHADQSERSVKALKDEFVTFHMLTNILGINGIVIKREEGKVFLDDKLRPKILRFLTQGLLFPQLSRSVQDLKNRMLDN
jgi:hypothetical protein